MAHFQTMASTRPPETLRDPPSIHLLERQGDSTWSPMPTLKPALSPGTELNLTIVYIAIYAALFVFVYVQLWMIWYYRHKRFSYQTVFLFNCLVWSGLRTTLFSFYFQDCQTANQLPLFLYWLLYCFPVCLQFTMLCLLVLFFAQVVFKARAKYEPSKYKKPLRVVVLLAVVVFVASNIACAVAVHFQDEKYGWDPNYLLYVRVAINDSLFVVFSIALSVCIFRMTKMSSSSLVLEAKGMRLWQAVVVSVVINLLFTSRAVYNFITVSPDIQKKLPGFGYDWVNVSDQVDNVKNLSESFAYLSFGIVLFVWEVLPITMVVIFFRVKRQTQDVTLHDISTSSRSSKVFFFDNPRRYDSDDDLTQVDSRSRSPLDSGSFSINRTASLVGTPRTTPQGTPILRGFQGRMGTPHRMSYGAMFSGGTPSSVSPTLGGTGVASVPVMTSASVGAMPGVVVSSSRTVKISPTADFPRPQRCGAAKSGLSRLPPASPIMTPPPQVILENGVAPYQAAVNSFHSDFNNAKLV